MGRETAIAYAKARAVAVCLGARTNLSEVKQEVQEAVVAAGKDPREVLTNIYGTYSMTRSFLPQLQKGSGKTIINITSVATQLLVSGASAYSTSKLALLRSSEFTNVEYGARGILAYSIHPVCYDEILSLPQ
ncbi:MAG: hypothetical protein Q9180_008159 [Flavoplaca navasiana]